jgi:hypothetical protein
VSRLEALALMQTLNANILASRSSTLSLEQWCRDHKLASTRRSPKPTRFICGRFWRLRRRVDNERLNC